MTDVWVDIDGYEGAYQVTSTGLVRSLDRVVVNSLGVASNIKGILLTVSLDRSGYPTIGLWRAGKVIRKKIHKLVAETFIGPAPIGHLVCHNDSIKTNNCVSNLRYGTAKSNQDDRVANGTRSFGQAHGRTKLTNEQVMSIFRSIDPTKLLAERYCVNSGTIWSIRNGRNWSHLTGCYLNTKTA